VTTTNGSATHVTLENGGGHVFSIKIAEDTTGTNLVVVTVGVEIVTNTAYFQQRLQTIIKRADGTNIPTSGNTTNLLFSRVFAVDPHTFVASLKNAGVDIGSSTNSAEQIVPALKNFFAKLGVNLELPLGKALFYNDKLGKLFVRATKDDLDIVEQAIEFLNCVPPQIHIKARFYEVPSGTMAGLGNFLNSTNSTTNQFTGILNATNRKLILRSLESRKDVETLAEPEVTTTSGRQTQMRATQIITVVTNFAFQESLTNNGTSSISAQTEPVETGPILDVVPYVLADGYTINLTVIPSLTEFLGYDHPPDVPNVTGTNNRVQLPVVLPQFSLRQMTANLNLWDGQTVVVGGMRRKNIVKDKTPVLGSVPFMGRMFRSQHTNETEILVFVTADIVDPAGNRVYKDDELPFAQTGVPTQPSPSK
jgi:type II secretory pathway component GspD/PulD (secretin)